MVRRRLTEPPPRLRSEPDIPADLRAAVLAMVRWAWARLATEGVDPRTAIEEDITEAIERLLSRKEGGRWLARPMRYFSPVFRGGKHRAADGSNQKAPDLTFRPRNTAGVRQVSDWALFAECKIIGGIGHTVGVYCGDDGVRRFAEGRYAPRMRHGLMIAYVRDNRLPHEALREFQLKGLHRKERESTDVARSTHRRGALLHPCVDIEVTHLWLAVTRPQERG